MATIEDYQGKEVYIKKAREAEDKYNIPPFTLVGLLAQESGHFNKDVVSGKKKSYAGAIGIGQFMPSTAKQYKINPLNVDQAIDASAKYLQSSYKQLGNWDDAIFSYNAGVGRVKQYKAGKPIKIKEHAEYVGKVKKQIQRYGGNNYVTTDVTDFEIPKQSSNFASVPQTEFQSAPDVYVEPKEEEDEDIKQVEQETNEQNFLQALGEQGEDNRQSTENIDEYQPIPESNVTETYNEVSNFVDNPLMQQGGNIPVSSNGVYDFPGQEVIVPTNNGQITMSKGKIIHEEPVLSEKEKAFLKYIKNNK